MNRGMAVPTDWSMFRSFALAVCLTRATIMFFCLRKDSDEIDLVGKVSAEAKECAVASERLYLVVSSIFVPFSAGSLSSLT
ncbi:hypothetical protein V8C26DRAFT_206262 [Trichoderma gracile]